MAELFGVEVQTVIHHLKEIYRSGELEAEATTRSFRVVEQRPCVRIQDISVI